MAEEKKEEAKKDEKKEDVKEDKKEEENKEEEEEKAQEIVLKVDMHCEACARKVARALKGFEGVEEVSADYKGSKVVVKGNAADPIKVCQRVQKKSHRKVEILSPLPKPNKPQENKVEEPKQDTNKEEPPTIVTVVLKVGMHCEACAQALEKKIGKVKGVESVTTDVANDEVTVKGVLNPDKLVKDIYHKTGKQASIVKDEEKKDEEKKDEKKEEKKQEEDNNEEDDKKIDVKKNEYLPPKYYMEYAYAPQMFSDENPNACSVM